MRLVALALLALVLATPASSRTATVRCPDDASLGSLRFTRGVNEHVVPLATCTDRIAGKAQPSSSLPLRSPDGDLAATIKATGSGRAAKQTIWIADDRAHRNRPVFSETEYYEQIGPGDTPGPIELLRFSTDDQWIFFTIDPGGSSSIAADGLVLRVVSTAGGRVHNLGVALAYPDYLAWCGGRLVYIGGSDRVAIHAKRLLVAAPPSWLPRALWRDRSRSFASPSCAPGEDAVAVLSQRSSVDANFFATRWRLWRIDLGGSRKLLDTPPTGWADEAPQWSRDGRSLLFVRERNGYGQVMLLRDGQLYGPLAKVGYSLGYYGHHDWRLRWSVGSP